jgi:hypothetical protein
LLAFTALAAFICGNIWNRVQAQRAAQRAVLEANGAAWVFQPKEETWIERIGLGELQQRMVAVGFSSQSIGSQPSGAPYIEFERCGRLGFPPLTDIEVYFFIHRLFGWPDHTCRADDETLAKLKNVGSQIEFLNLDNPIFTDAAMRHMRLFPNLSVLRVSNTSITDAGLKHLAYHPNLRYVFLDNTNVTDQGIDVLATIPKLVQVTLNHTATTQTALDRLKSLRPDMIWPVDE